MNLNLNNKHVLITGGSKGIGLACARLFLAEGAKVALISRSQTHLDNARQHLGDVFTLAADLRNADAAAAMVEEVENRFGAIDVLVNSAGAAQRSVPEDLSPPLWRAAMDAKYFTYINVIDPVIKLMAARGQGVIVNVIGTGGKVPSPVHLPGGAANAALMLATTGLANAYAGKGVRVVGVNPGFTKTERIAEGLKVEAKRSGIDESEALQRMVASLPLGRPADPEEIASIVVFASSERGRFLTGANITSDGAATPSVV
ncbi:MAG: SDR family NAD(P)-dependent oxidoreductase [Porticoccaceae bacterium]|nr:SDR family NAD(P)-dependent oxidoreductase [Porticoccaceae bacterium]